MVIVTNQVLSPTDQVTSTTDQVPAPTDKVTATTDQVHDQYSTGQVQLMHLLFKYKYVISIQLDEQVLKSPYNICFSQLKHDYGLICGLSRLQW